MQLDDTDRQLLNLLQGDFPLAPQPYAELGARLGLSEETVMARVQALQEGRVLRQINAIFDSRRLGYRATLVALRLPPKRIDAAAGRISQHPGVSHNYRRNHRYNLWFTLTVPPGEDPEATAHRLAQEVEAESTLYLPALRQFKLGVFFDMTGDSQTPKAAPAPSVPSAPSALNEGDVALVQALQQSLPVASRPFWPLAQQLGLSEAALLAQARGLKERGLMRRFGAVLYHREAGFAANAMVCWRADPARVEELGQALAAFPQVTHAYQRPTYPDWPYGVYTMIHARTRQECHALAATMAEKIGLKDYLLLFSTKEYKKQRVSYFT